MTDEPQPGDDFNYMLVRAMIGVAAVGIMAGLVAIIVACFRTIP